jgi:hypothetical protein
MTTSTSTSAITASLPATSDPHSEFLYQRKLDCDEYLSKLTPHEHEPGKWFIFCK